MNKKWIVPVAIAVSTAATLSSLAFWITKKRKPVEKRVPLGL